MNSGQLQHITLAKLTRADILEWWEHVSWDFPDKYAQNHKGYIRLRQALKQAVVQGLTPFNPAENLGIPLPDKADKYLPTDLCIRRPAHPSSSASTYSGPPD